MNGGERIMEKTHNVMIVVSPMLTVMYRCPESGLCVSETLEYLELPELIKCRYCGKPLFRIKECGGDYIIKEYEEVRFEEVSEK